MEFFPLIDIQEFNDKRLSGNENFSYSELRGLHHIERPHRHQFFLLVLFEQGGGIHTIDFNNYSINNKQIHLLFPKQVHSWTLEEDTVGYQVMIDREHFEKFSPNFLFSYVYYQLNPVITLPDTIFDLFLCEFKAIQHELEKKIVYPNLFLREQP